MYGFIGTHRDAYAVEPICRVLEIAPSGYYVHRTRQADPSRRPARALRDERLRRQVRHVWRANHQVYGVRKVWRRLKRDGTDVARCTVERLMRAEGIQGVVRGGRVHTTRPPENQAALPQDLVQRQFTAECPNQQRLLEPLGYVPPAELEEQFFRTHVGVLN